MTLRIALTLAQRYDCPIYTRYMEQKKRGIHIICIQQGPNPFAAMAVILILSENVADVQALVSLLRGCMSEVAITEFLSHMAMLLFAMMRNNIQISNR